MNKQELIDQLLNQLKAEHGRAVASAVATAAGSTHEESKAEGSKDTRSTEAGYLARGQAMRVEELAEVIARIEHMEVLPFHKESPIGSSAVVCIAHEDESLHWFFIVPFGGGHKLALDGKVITTLTPRSPLGTRLIEKTVDDIFEFPLNGKVQEMEIVEVL